ncbi:hypothetical protein LEN26_002134 [Aphanomyces euteiches]|nr:hypothetical protein AeMF1_011088 [Aphanomyces euteiches]KAH9159864.1 hypothetical protein LEN26_002134 [Aphanomyces euteiches]KAH9194973.1 hypothetical protein AeNC1_003046 [Aphanomyces euteiches]
MTTKSLEPPALKVDLDLYKVTFPWRSETYHVRLELTQKTLPMRLWFQDNESKLQWKCDVSDIREGKPKDDEYSLPAEVVLAALEGALFDLRVNASSNNANQHDILDLESVDDGSLKLVLTLTLFGQFKVVYAFVLEPVSVEKIDILEAKVQDVEMVNKLPTQFHGFYAVSATATRYYFVAWTMEKCSSDTDLFEFNDALTTVKVWKVGFYYIQVSGYREWTVDHDISILVDSETVASACRPGKSCWQS